MPDDTAFRLKNAPLAHEVVFMHTASQCWIDDVCVLAKQVWGIVFAGCMTPIRYGEDANMLGTKNDITTDANMGWIGKLLG